ncbi:UvrD-helicase domain-containing protein [Mariniradius sediminis]|uniref:DNA 3'-5' helicase n=1 Tax=Mariniradius sediminis TaxID=2909237 RepID=A0ABS9BXD8_9BACT|nr:UvrD-helicase domain-containing protein [Mariniradius sediminis]MCF1752296.1 UvrD-helicase domain-containing protein [Mariniradius sediminis]
MQTKPFVIYKSSAGSGKTYTLTKEYLKLALRNPIAFRGILAVTFTNKATHEMKERILSQLARLRVEVVPEETMDAELMEALGCGEEGLKEKANLALSAILHDYGRFSVSTIDSFFQKIVRAFAREMDLNAQFELELDQDAVLSKTVDRVIEKAVSDTELHQWMVEYAIEQIQEGKSWDIRKNIQELANKIFQEDFKKYGNEIRKFLDDKDALEGLKNFARKGRAEIIAEAKNLKSQANQIRQRHGLEWTDFKGGSRSFANKFDRFGEMPNPIADLRNTKGELPPSVNEWYTKTSKSAQAIISAYEEGLGSLIGKALELEQRWNTIIALGRNIYVFGLFRYLLDELAAVKDEENILLISDANEFLKEITAETDAPFIYEKVGNQFRHFLIDEFQDTSGFQWASFKPLLQNSLAQGNANLLVGDVKQSIYRWRGGDMRLMLEEVESEIGLDYIQEKNLDTNFRSLPNIIDFNNALFKHLPQAFESKLERDFGTNGQEIISKAYSEVFQHVSARKVGLGLGGLVRFEVLEGDREEEEGKFLGQVLAKVPQMVIELQQKGYGLRDIAFLVRTKAEGEEIADCLMDYAHQHPDTGFRFDVLSDESMFLTKSVAVVALEAALRYLSDPKDELAWKTMWYYYAVGQGNAIGHALFSSGNGPDWVERGIAGFENEISGWIKLPLMELVEELIEQLGIKGEGLEMAYIAAFKEAVYDFTQFNRADLAGFLEWWEQEKGKRTVKIPESHEAMRILTIHKSKGLQFKVVLMPFLKWTIFDTTKSNILWAPFQAQGLDAIVPLRLDKKLGKSAFSELYRSEAVMSYLDSLNMLYVAFTRAEEVLWGLLPFQKEPKGSSIQNFVQQYVERVGKGEYGSYDADSRVYELGIWPKKSQQTVASAPVVPLRWEYQAWDELLQVREFAGDFSESGLERRRKREFGSMIHELLEKSGSKAEVMMGLEELHFEGRLDQVEQETVKSQLDRLFDNPVFASWFSGEYPTMVEQGIILPGGQQKRPDRILVGKDCVRVVDFKTGEAQEKYMTQLLEYMALVGEMTGLPAKGFICYLESAEIVEVAG